MKLIKIYNSRIFNLFIYIILLIILYSNCFRFTTEPDDLIIKFNIENLKFKNNEYVSKVKNKVKKEMKIIKNKLSYMKIPDDLDNDSPFKIYEIQNASISSSNNWNDNINQEDENGVNDFEEKDMIRKPKFSKMKTHLKNNTNFNTSEIDQFKALVYNKDTNNITFNYSIINENNIEKKKILKFFISTLLECNVMVNETIAYKSPEKIKSILHYLNTDRETRISPVGVYSSLGQVDYFAFQRSTKTFKVDFLEELTKTGKGSFGAEVLNERKFFRSFEENNDKDRKGFESSEGKDNFDYDYQEDEIEEKENGKIKGMKGKFRKQGFFAFDAISGVNFLDVKENVEKLSFKTAVDKEVVANKENSDNKNNSTNASSASANVSNNNKNNNNNKLKKNNIIDFHNSKKTSETTETKFSKISTNTKSKKLISSSSASSAKSVNSTVSAAAAAFVDFSLEYIYDAKHLIHSVSDFRSTPDFNNITYNYDRFIWNLINENSDKSDETVKIELFFDMEESFYSENIFVNLNFTKSIFLLNQTEKRAIENSYTKIDSNIMLEVANYAYSDGAVYLMEKVMNSSPDLDRIEYYVKSKKNKNKNDLIKIMKVEAEKVLRYNESFQLEVKFPLYFENCRNYKTNTMIMITGIVLMVFLGSLLYLVVSLNFSDKE